MTSKRPTWRKPTAPAGFTLIELMVTVAVLVILVAIAIPSFTGIINANRLTAASNELVAALQYARSEAIRTNRRAIACLSTSGAGCLASVPAAGTGNLTILTLADEDRDGSAEVVRSVPVRSNFSFSTAGSIGDAVSVTFRPDGRAYDGDTLLTGSIGVCLATTQPAENIRRVAITAGSRIGTEWEIGSDGTCPE